MQAAATMQSAGSTGMQGDNRNGGHLPESWQLSGVSLMMPMQGRVGPPAGQEDELSNGDPPDVMLWGEE